MEPKQNLALEAQPGKHRSLSARFSLFTLALLGWVFFVFIVYDLLQGNLNIGKSVFLLVISATVAMAIARITIRILVKPLETLERGLQAAGEGRFEPIRFRRSGDEIEYLARSFNHMIETLAQNRDEIQQHQETLESRIRKRTEELEEAMHHALAASRAKSEFLANMSHELRTPMNGILGMLELAIDSPLTAEQREHLEIAKQSGHSLLALLNDLLDISKIESGRMTLEQIPFGLRGLLNECVRPHMAAAKRKNLTIQVHFGPGLPEHVIGDPLRFRQILHNLLSNALKFTEHGHIRVELESQRIGDSEKHRIQLLVSDTGTGIPADKLPVIFDKFTQADGSISRRYGGTGLGLAITKRLVELHGGTISVTSQVGRGSDFFVTLPMRAELANIAGGTLSQAPQRTSEVSQRAAHILVAEDNPVNQKVVTGLLRRRGYVVTLASDGEKAISALEEKPFDAVLMDLQMPALDGLEATRRIRGKAKWKALPIIAMTAHAMNGDRERCLASGMDGYISKPVNSAQLYSTLEAMLSRKLSAPLDNAEDAAQAEELSPFDDGDADLINSMLRLFLSLVPERVQKLRNALEQADYKQMMNEARMVESSASDIAAKPVIEQARRVQSAINAGDEAAIRHSILLLEAGLQRLARNSTVKPEIVGAS